MNEEHDDFSGATMKKFIFLAANPWGKADKIIVCAESKREARFILLRCGYRNIEFLQEA